MKTQLSDANYHGDLGDGLICRWSTAADCEKIGTLMGTVFRRSPTAPLNIRAADEARIFMSDKFPWAGAGDIAVVEDTSKPDAPIVACTSVWHHQWSYGGIGFGVGRPENVATAAGYRNRGLIRALFAMFHARSAAEGHLAQAITGIPYYYRQFGYEYVLDLSSFRAIPITRIPDKKPEECDNYQLRLATLEDVPWLLALYNQLRTANLVWHETDERYWRYHIEGWEDPVVQQKGPTAVGFYGRVYLIVDEKQERCGYAWLGAKRWSESLGVYALQLASHVNWQAAFPALLRLLRQYGETLAVIEENSEPFRTVNFSYRPGDPISALLDERFEGSSEPPYAWYLRVADIPGFVRHVAPVLEERLARSILTGHTGELRLSFYRSGLRLQFDNGKLLVSEPYQAPVDQEEEHGGCPPLVFLQLLFGYRSLSELRAVFPDVWVKQEAVLLINTLFPKVPSCVYGLSFT
ncbi:MAG: GNAT family N-acetyltransferase [Caldilineaceae bacterium]